MILPHAVIIAGGKGERLGGVRKADLRVGGVRQIDRVIAALGSVAAPVLVATGPNGRTIDLPASCMAVPDLDGPTGGPLAGLVAAVDWLARQGIVEGVLVSVAVDTPLLPANFAGRMMAGIGPGRAAFAAWGASFYPPNAAWRLEELQDLPGHVRSGTAPASIKALQQTLEARRIDWGGEGGADPFRSINSVADLVTLQRIARG